MSSQLKVNSIRDTSNNEAFTISSGNVSFNNTISAGTIGGGVKVVSAVDTFKITESTITPSGNAITSTAYSNTFYTPVSGVVTVSSDVFTFSQTGVYIFNYMSW